MFFSLPVPKMQPLYSSAPQRVANFRFLNIFVREFFIAHYLGTFWAPPQRDIDKTIMRISASWV